MIRATSADDPQVGQQASIQIEGSDRWLSALVPVHAPRGSRASTTRAVPVVGCLVHNSSHPHHDRFVLSWARQEVWAPHRLAYECTRGDIHGLQDLGVPTVVDGASLHRSRLAHVAISIDDSI